MKKLSIILTTILTMSGIIPIKAMSISLPFKETPFSTYSIKKPHPLLKTPKTPKRHSKNSTVLPTNFILNGQAIREDGN